MTRARCVRALNSHRLGTCCAGLLKYFGLSICGICLKRFLFVEFGLVSASPPRLLVRCLFPKVLSFLCVYLLYSLYAILMQGILLRMNEIQCVVQGNVQQVAYRAYVQDSATELGLVGYVHNNADGTVSVTAQGAIDVLKDFVEYLHEGSSLSQVESVSVDWVAVKTVYDEFSIKHV